MSLFISFSWTTEPFLKGAKTMTRRYWKSSHAEKFHKNMLISAYDKLPFRNGKVIGHLKITKDLYQQRTSELSEEDFEKEGLLWMSQHNLKIMGKTPEEFFEEWKQKNDLVWVIEFERKEPTNLSKYGI